MAYNCYLYVQKRIYGLPRTSELHGNSVHPVVGGVIILNYNGTLHYVFVEDVLASGPRVSETNLVPGEYTTRVLSWEYIIDHQGEYWNPTSYYETKF